MEPRQKAVLLKCLIDRNGTYHFGSLIELVQETGQWSHILRSGTLTSAITSGLFVYILSIRVANVRVIVESFLEIQ